MLKKPYVVSADIYLLLKEWSVENNFILPPVEFFSKLRSKFSNRMANIFQHYEFISENEIADYLSYVSSKSNLPVVSLDPIYFKGDYSLELTRSINSHGMSVGLKPRSGSKSMIEQLAPIIKSGQKEICLIDDVIFSGSIAESVICELHKVGIKVPLMCSGIGIQKGIDRVSSDSCRVSCLKVYEDVVDEVCERDFYFGIPFSGRSIHDSQNLGLPYFLPYGNAHEWASIPVSFQKSFSRFCIQQSILLFEEIEKSSKQIIDCSDIKRKAPNQPKKGRYVDFLKTIKI